jgi:3-hydroxyacyl-[acyl-carrier-protein] dehydratase
LLLNDLYFIETVTKNDRRFEVHVRLDPAHAIFSGHFPGQPVLPGVCMLEMICEITGIQLKSKFRIVGSRVIKFLNMVDPNKTPLIRIDIDISENQKPVELTGKIYDSATVFMKYQLQLNAEW